MELTSPGARPVPDVGPLARQLLLDVIVDHVIARGPREQSLRSLAAAIGVSHSLVLYHFGSTAGLQTAMHAECIRRERGHLEQLSSRLTTVPPAEIWPAMWAGVSVPALWPLYRLTFALRARSDVRDAERDLARQAWEETVAPLVRRVGVPPADERREVMMWVAACRGLIWELISGSDPAVVDAAARQFSARFAGPASALLGR